MRRRLLLAACVLAMLAVAAESAEPVAQETEGFEEEEDFELDALVDEEGTTVTMHRAFGPEPRPSSERSLASKIGLLAIVLVVALVWNMWKVGICSQIASHHPLSMGVS